MNIESATPLYDMDVDSLAALLSAYLRPEQRGEIECLGKDQLIRLLEAQGLHADGEYKDIFDIPGEIVEGEFSLPD